MYDRAKGKETIRGIIYSKDPNKKNNNLHFLLINTIYKEIKGFPGLSFIRFDYQGSVLEDTIYKQLYEKTGITREELEGEIRFHGINLPRECPKTGKRNKKDMLWGREVEAKQHCIIKTKYPYPYVANAKWHGFLETMGYFGNIHHMEENTPFRAIEDWHMFIRVFFGTKDLGKT